MMKKIFRFMFATAGVMALASCADDSDLTSKDFDIKLQKGDIVATVEKAYAEGTDTRAAMGEFGETPDVAFVWTEGDNFKLYGATTWRTDVYTLNETNYNRTKGAFTGNGVFEGFYGDKLSENDAAYAVYPTDACSINEDRTLLTIELQKEIEYSKIDPAYRGAVKEDEASEVTGTAYGVQRPMWGFVTANSETLGGKVNFFYMTTVLRVVIENGLPEGAKYIVVQSDDEDDKLSGTFTADIKEITDKFWADKTGGQDYGVPTLIGAEDAKNYVYVNLEGAVGYDHVVYIPIPAQHYNGNLSVVLASAVEENDGEFSYIPVEEVTFVQNQTTEERQITNGVLRTYASRDFVTEYYYTVGTIKGMAETDCSLISLTEINKWLKTLNVDRDMMINFTGRVVSWKEQGKYDDWVKADNVLEIPNTWTGSHKVVLNFNGGATANETSLMTSGGTVQAKDSPTGAEVEAATMVVENKSATTNVVINVKNVASMRPVNVSVEENAGKVTLGTNVSVITANAGSVVVDGQNNAAGFSVTSVTADEDATADISIENATVTTVTNNGKGKVTVTGAKANVTTLTNYGGNLSVVEGAYVYTLDNEGTGNVSVNKGGFFELKNENNKNTGNVEIKDIKQNAMSVHSVATGKLTIESEAVTTGKFQIHRVATMASEVSIKNVDIAYPNDEEYLRFSGDLTSVALENCEVAKLVYNGSKDVELTSKGNTFIKSVYEGTTEYGNIVTPKMTFKSEWNGTTTTSKAVSKAVTATYNVYTAAELALLLNTSSIENLTVNLYADIDLGEENAWTGIEAFRKSSGNMAFNGNGHTISNVNITTPANKDYYLSGDGFINSTGATGSFTAEDLKLTGVNTNKMKNFGSRIAGVGGFVGVQNNTGTYKKISVTGTYLGVETGAEVAEATTKGVLHVGGLIGALEDKNAKSGASTTPKTTIEECTVNVSEIEGLWSLGGLVGDARDGEGGEGSIELAMAKNTVTVGDFNVTLTLAANKNSDKHYGKVGMLLGTINGGGSATKLTFGTTEGGKTSDDNTVTDCIINNRSNLHFGWCTRLVNNDNAKFVGKIINSKNGNAIYVGHSEDFYDKTNLVEGLGEAVKKIDDFNCFESLGRQEARKR